MKRYQAKSLRLGGLTVVYTWLAGCANLSDMTPAEFLELAKGGAELYATTQAAKASRSMARLNDAQANVLRQTASAAPGSVPVATTQQAASSRLTVVRRVNRRD